MTKEEFLKALRKNLKWLSKQEREEELVYYENRDNYDLDPIIIANEIYKKRGLKILLIKKIKFLDAVNILIKSLQSKNKELLKKVLLFFLYMFFLIIIIKIPFIYIRDMISNIFIDTFKNNSTYALWALSLELLYALTAILIFIRMIKNKAIELEKEDK
jgi:hypothetical protein